MSKLDELIAELCPDGVEYRLFFDVCDYIRGITYNKNDEINDNSYGIEVLRANNITLETNTLNFDDVKLISENVKIKETQWLKKNDILICAGSGSKEHIGKVAYIFADTNITFGGFMGVVRPKIENFSPRFLFHILTSDMFKSHLAKVSAASSSTINNINNDTWKNFQIPVPPLAVQEEIVRILDKFTSLTAELTAELTARRKQYEYYRDALLTPPFTSVRFDYAHRPTTDRNNNQLRVLGSTGSPTKARLLSGAEASNVEASEGTREAKVEMKKLGEICQQISNIKWKYEKNSFQYIDLTSVDRETHEIINTTKIDSSNAPSRALQIVKENDVLFGTTRPMLKRSTFISKEFDGQICSTGYCVLRPNQEIVKPRYIYHHINSSLFYQYVETHQQGASYPAISDADVKNFTIPLPPLSVQQRIVNVLDNFDAICSDLKIGLPAEIDARKKQYEYYCDLLLTFAERGNTILTEQNRTEQNRTEQNRTEQMR